MKNLKIALVAFCFLGYTQSNAQIRDIVNAVKSSKELSKSSGSTGTITESNGVIKVSGNDHVKTFTMTGENLEVHGNDHKITVKGNATQVTVFGTGNTVTVDSVNKITINGVDNKVYYRSSSNKNGKVSTSVSGVDSNVIKIR